VKMRIGWTDATVRYHDVAKMLSGVNTLGEHSTSRISSYGISTRLNMFSPISKKKSFKF